LLDSDFESINLKLGLLDLDVGLINPKIGFRDYMVRHWRVPAQGTLPINP